MNLQGDRLCDHGYVLRRFPEMFKGASARKRVWGLAACVSLDHEAAYFFAADERAT